VTESTGKGDGFLADLCGKWEQWAGLAKSHHTRVVILRMGVVLDQGGGALSKMLPAFNFFLGGPIGSGRQWFPWVHREDVIEIVLFALNEFKLEGAVNVAAPKPVTMKEFGKVLGCVIKRPFWFPTPGFVLKALVGEMSEMLLTGQRAIPQKLMDLGYKFRFPEVDFALDAIMKGRS